MPHPLRDGDPIQIGPYRLRARLGGGGMGQVFLGRSPGGRLVAVKAVRPELADNAHFRRRFAAEVEAARKVGGFYTAQVVDAGADADPPWLATAYIPGPSLHQAVDEHGPLPLESVAVLGAGLAEGLAAVHASEVVHRDLKPANVILAEDGPRLIDFGIARALDATSQTQTAAVLGTAAFMSPEQATAQPVGPASDVFSLGCVLAYAATGRGPFGDGPVHAIVYRVVHGDPDLTGVPAPLAGLVAACLAKDPAARPGLEQVLDRLSGLASAGDGPGPVRWLPETLTQVIADRRTLALTALEQPAPPPPPGPVTGPPLLVNERRHLRGGRPLYPATGYEIAVYVLLALFALVSGVAAIHQLTVGEHAEQIGLLEAYEEIRDPVEEVAIPLMVVQAVLGALLVVCWLLWFARVRAVAERLAPGRLRYRPAMAVYGWFVPLAGLVLPKQIADDVWHASSPPRHDRAMAPAGLLHAWWAVWLATFLTWPVFWLPWTEFFRPGDVEYEVDDESYHLYDLEPIGWVILVTHLLAVPAAVVTALYVRRLSAMQAARLSGSAHSGARRVPA
ncbi:DUF4328 domain-containing protein [Nonomuraea sp. NPDC049725]|uniref:protein kinase domain-containing protein n=1 Tax=Nonomuraea sp. NPDC049725 TaxID=3154508 RepID=UPI00343B00C0